MRGENPEPGVVSATTAAAKAGNRNDEILASLDEALKNRPRDVHILNSRGTLLGSLGRFQEASACFEKALAVRPADADLRYNFAYSLHCLGRFGEALTAYTQVLAVRPGYVAALNNRGLVLDAMGRCNAAIADFRQALGISPNDVPTLNNIGRCLTHVGRANEAVSHFKKALTLDPNHRQAVEGLEAAYRVLDRPEVLAEVCRQLVGRAPNAALAWVALGAALVALNNRSEAEICFRRALALGRNEANVHDHIGRALLESGDLAGAERAFSTAIDLNPRSPQFLHSLTKVRQIRSDDRALAALEDLSQNQETLGIQERATLHFAFGKALTDMRENEQGFTHYLEANRLQCLRRSYDEAATLSRIAAVAEVFSTAIVQRCSNAGTNSRIPIFVLGMPRTGSTLVEQILAAHPRVFALGELSAFEEAVGSLDARKGLSFPTWLPDLGSADLSALAQHYLARISSVALGRNSKIGLKANARLVDKEPTNFLYAGLIHLAFPKASIIHTRRDPINTCLSCFQVLFESLPYTNDLGTLGRFYRHYALLMNVWNETLPQGSILTVDYETLVNDFEGSARKIVGHCGLDWDDACLSFHDVKRPVRTASAAQVRKPLYFGSLKKWRPSDDVLRPLLEGLGELPDERYASCNPEARAFRGSSSVVSTEALGAARVARTS